VAVPSHVPSEESPSPTTIAEFRRILKLDRSKPKPTPSAAGEAITQQGEERQPGQ